MAKPQCGQIYLLCPDVVGGKLCLNLDKPHFQDGQNGSSLKLTACKNKKLNFQIPSR